MRHCLKQVEVRSSKRGYLQTSTQTRGTYADTKTRGAYAYTQTRGAYTYTKTGGAYAYTQTRGTYAHIHVHRLETEVVKQRGRIQALCTGGTV